MSQSRSISSRQSVLVRLRPPACVEVVQEDVESVRGSAEIVLGRIADGEQTPCNTGFFVVRRFEGGYPTMRKAKAFRQLPEELMIVHAAILAAFRVPLRWASTAAEFFQKQ